MVVCWHIGTFERGDMFILSNTGHLSFIATSFDTI